MAQGEPTITSAASWRSCLARPGNVACSVARASGARFRAMSPVDYHPARARACTRSVTAPRSSSVFKCVDQARAMGGKWHIDEDRRLISLVFFATVGSSSKKYWTSTFSTAAICTIMAALMRLTPFSYFWIC
jgi:hypothetical protein